MRLIGFLAKECGEHFVFWDAKESGVLSYNLPIFDISKEFTFCMGISVHTILD